MATPIKWLRYPKKGETMLQLLKVNWAKMSWGLRLKTIGNRLPELVAELIGLGGLYWWSVHKYGFITWWAPHNLYRQIFHFGGGISLFSLINLIAWWPLAIGAVLYYAIRKELADMKHGANVKSMLDLIFWVLGALVGFYLMQM